MNSQGDPVCPCLFILYAKILAQKNLRASANDTSFLIVKGWILNDFIVRNLL